MKLWECHYIVNTHYSSFAVRDYIWATSKPSLDSVGHYWKTLFSENYLVTNEEVKESEYFSGMNLSAVIVNF